MADIIKAQNELTLARVHDGEAGSITIRYANELGEDPDEWDDEYDPHIDDDPNPLTKYLGILKENTAEHVPRRWADYKWSLIKGNDGDPSDSITVVSDTLQNDPDKIAYLNKVTTLDTGTVVTVKFEEGNICPQRSLTFRLDMPGITGSSLPIKIYEDANEAVYSWEKNSYVSLIYIDNGLGSYWQVLNNWTLSKIADIVNEMEGFTVFNNIITNGTPNEYRELNAEEKENFSSDIDYYERERIASWDEKTITSDRFYWERKESFKKIIYILITSEDVYDPTETYYKSIINIDTHQIDDYIELENLTESRYNELVSQQSLYKITENLESGYDIHYVNVDVGDSYDKTKSYYIKDNTTDPSVYNLIENLQEDDDSFPTPPEELNIIFDYNEAYIDISYDEKIQENFRAYIRRGLYIKFNDEYIKLTTDATYDSTLTYYLRRNCFYWWQDKYRGNFYCSTDIIGRYELVDSGEVYSSEKSYYTYTPESFVLSDVDSFTWDTKKDYLYVAFKYEYDWTSINGSSIHSGTILLGGQKGEAGKLNVMGGYFSLARNDISYDDDYNTAGKYVVYNSSTGKYESHIFESEWDDRGEEYEELAYEDKEQQYINFSYIDVTSDVTAQSFETYLDIGLFISHNEGEYNKLDKEATIPPQYSETETYYVKRTNFYLDLTNDTVVALDENGMAITWGRIDINNGMFEVDYDGNIIAESAEITGTVNATGGTFTDVEILDNLTIYKYEEDENGKEQKISTSFITLGGGEIKSNNYITDNSKGFCINADGNIVANNIILGTSATIDKFLKLGIEENSATIYNPAAYSDYRFIESGEIRISSQGKMQIGDLLFDGVNSSIQGSNWHIDTDFAEFNNANIRGKLVSSVFEQSTTSLVGGTMLFKNAEIIDHIECDNDNNVTIITLTKEANMKYLSADSSDIVTLLQKDSNSQTDNFKVYKIQSTNKDLFTVTIEGIVSTSQEQINLYESGLLVEVGYNTIDNNLIPDWFIGINSTQLSRGFNLYKNSLTFNESLFLPNEEEENETYFGKLKLTPTIVLGDLADVKIVGEYARASNAEKGLFAQNVVLTGQLTTRIPKTGENIRYAGINSNTGIQFNEDALDIHLMHTDTSEIMFWGGAKGAEDNEIQVSPFQVTTQGTLFAKQAYIQGSIIADSVLSTSVIRTPWIDGSKDAEGDSVALYITNTGTGILFKDGSYKEAQEDNPDNPTQAECLTDIFEVRSVLQKEVENNEPTGVEYLTGSLKLNKREEYQHINVDENKFNELQGQLYHLVNEEYKIATTYIVNEKYFIKNGKEIFSVNNLKLNFRQQLVCADEGVNIANSTINLGRWSFNDSSELSSFNTEWSIGGDNQRFFINRGKEISAFEIDYLSVENYEEVVTRINTKSFFNDEINALKDIALSNDTEVNYGENITIIPYIEETLVNNITTKINKGFDLYIRA